MNGVMHLVTDPAAWLALITLVVMELVLGIDNLVFISILSNKLPAEQRPKARHLGFASAMVLRLILLGGIAFIVHLTVPAFDLGIAGPIGEHGEPTFETAFSWRDLILIAGGLFLVWKSTNEIHHSIDPTPSEDLLDKKHTMSTHFAAAIVQIMLLNLVFSIDSILTAVGMTSSILIMGAAVVISVGAMMVAAGPMAHFINKNPTIVMLALGFLLMIGAVLIADGFGVHVPKGYIYAAMAFSGVVEALNMASRNAKAKKGDKGGH